MNLALPHSLIQDSSFQMKELKLENLEIEFNENVFHLLRSSICCKIEVPSTLIFKHFLIHIKKNVFT